MQKSLFFSYIFWLHLHTYFLKWNFHNTFTIQSKTPPQFSLTTKKKGKNLYYDGKGRKRSHNKKIIYLCCTLIFTCLCACCFFEFHSCISFQKKALVEKRKVWLKSFVYFIFFFYNFINNFFSKFFPSLIPLPLYTKCYKQINPSPYHTSTQWVLM